jgi:hypothetical protein
VLVSPVVEKHCIKCHRPGTEGEKFDLTPEKSYDAMVNFGSPSLREHVLARYRQGRSVAGACASTVSPLVRLLKRDHYGVTLQRADWDRLLTWIDTYAQRRGSFSADQEEHLRQLRGRMKPILAARHRGE